MFLRAIFVDAESRPGENAGVMSSQPQSAIAARSASLPASTGKTVTVEITLSEEDAACIFFNRWRPDPGDLPKFCKAVLMDHAAEYRNAFPGSCKAAVRDFRECHRETSPAGSTWGFQMPDGGPHPWEVVEAVHHARELVRARRECYPHPVEDARAEVFEELAEAIEAALDGAL